MQTPSHSDSSKRQVIPFTTYVDKELAPEEFIKRLHHTHNFDRPGYIFFVSLNENSPRQFASTSLSKYSNVENIYSQLGYRRDTYISVNEFRSDKERDTNNAYSIHVLYLDLDFHIVDENGLCQSESIKSLVEKAKQHLSTLILTGDLLMPSCITDTGRGLGIFYILDSAIAVTQKTEKLRNFYTFIYDLLMKRFKTLFCDIYPDVVDSCVKDLARVCRIPGTFNFEAKRDCLMIDMECRYYSLQEIAEGCKLFQLLEPINHVYNRASIKTTYKNRNNSKADFDTCKFAQHRIKALKNLAQLLQECEATGWHEKLCFVLYATVKNAYDKTVAECKLIEFNASLNIPLEPMRINAILRQKKKYTFKNSTLAEWFGLSDIDMRSTGLSTTLKAISREEAKEATKKAREEKNAQAIEFIRKNPDLKRKDWLEAINSMGFKMSMRTLDTLAKSADLGKRKDTLAYKETAVYKNELTRKKEVAEKRAKVNDKVSDKKSTKMESASSVNKKVKKIEKVLDSKQESSKNEKKPITELPTDRSVEMDQIGGFRLENAFLEQKAFERFKRVVSDYEKVNAIYIKLKWLRAELYEMLFSGDAVGDMIKAVERVMYYLPRCRKNSIKSFSEKMYVDLVDTIESDPRDIVLEVFKAFKKIVKEHYRQEIKSFYKPLYTPSEKQQAAWEKYRAKHKLKVS